MWDKIYDVFWEGPFSWEEALDIQRPEHVLYAIFGEMQGRAGRGLLHLQRTPGVGGAALDDHAGWVEALGSEVEVRLASVGHFSTWKEWRAVSRHPAAPREIVEPIEALLVRAHRPSRIPEEHLELAEFHQLRVFNSGHRGSLHQETSYRFYMDP